MIWSGVIFAFGIVLGILAQRTGLVDKLLSMLWK